MSRLMDNEILERSHSARIAYKEGQRDMCEEIRELASQFLSQIKVNPYREGSDFEQGQLTALAAIIEGCNSFEAATKESKIGDTQFDA